MDLSLVVFDVDGTLIDSQDSIVTAMHRAFAGAGRPMPDRAEVLSVVGLSLADAVARLAPDLDAHEVADAVDRYRAAFIGLRAETGGEATAPLYPGARAAIEALHARPEVLLGVATGKARRGLDHAFAGHDLDRFFVTRQTADHHPSKPHPAMLEAALAETGVVPGRAVMVGDTTFDIEMARAAGVLPIGVAWGYHPPEALQAAGAAMVLQSFAQLPDALDQIWKVSA
ncbi:HAD-IA family hydrolase [Maritimibacter sp. HL-12]|uniref:HAD-IA family hydrolase n=1 Tax=Maritimibacter sp. HL-12 TaxID=1162418 RepID=UPI000A0F0C01|nr:HAD-IA family hydrolase [Maritimibacter sp. HL-12]SMH49607.1 phosphoglycolate phosphatase [Maritimibacter sp. HL-12]